MDFRDWLNDNYYNFLGVSPLATPAEIHKAFRRKAKTIHPDIYPLGSLERDMAEKDFRQLQSIKETLLDPEKKAVYDQERLLAQDCFLSAMTYEIPVKKEETEDKPSFRETLKKAEAEELKTKKYNYDRENNTYQEEDEDMLTAAEKSVLYKKRGAKRYYEQGVRAVAYGDYNRAWVCFNSARYLDPELKVPYTLWQQISRARHNS